MELWFYIMLGIIGVITLIIIIATIIHNTRKPIPVNNSKIKELPKDENVINELNSSTMGSAFNITQPNEEDLEEEERLFNKALKKSKNVVEAKDDKEYYGSGFSITKMIIPLISITVFIGVGYILISNMLPVLQSSMQTMNTSGYISISSYNNMIDWIPWIIAPFLIIILFNIMRPLSNWGD